MQVWCAPSFGNCIELFSLVKTLLPIDKITHWHWQGRAPRQEVKRVGHLIPPIEAKFKGYHGKGWRSHLPWLPPWNSTPGYVKWAPRFPIKYQPQGRHDCYTEGSWFYRVLYSSFADCWHWTVWGVWVDQRDPRVAPRAVCPCPPGSARYAPGSATRRTQDRAHWSHRWDYTHIK